VLIGKDIACALDPVLFAKQCGIICDSWQAALLRADPKNKKRVIINASRQSGKSTVTALDSLHTALFEPASLIVIVAPAQRQSAEMLRSIKGLHKAFDGGPQLSAESVLKLEFENESRILALPSGDDGKTIRGLANARKVIVDEASRVIDSAFQAVRPMIAVNAKGSLTLLSTPAGMRGTFWEIWKSNDPSWHRVRVPASECPRISPEFLAEELKALGTARFSEEYELAFIDSDTAAFSSSIIDAAFSDATVRPLWR